MATTKTNPHWLWLTRCLAVQVTLLLLVDTIAPSAADNDWDTNCGVCTCKWISGKKSANCRNQSFTMIPTEVSSDIQVIDLSYNQMSELRRSEFLKANLGNLHKIYLHHCFIREINKDALNGLQVLIELDLSQNQLKLLHPGTFNGLIKLRTLLLNNNNIERLENNLFSNLPFLSKLEVRSNRLYHVGLHVFNLTFKVINIDFEQNQLSILKKETFKNLIDLKSLSLNGNPWNCTCNLQQFQKFVIANKLYTPPTSCMEPPHLRDKLWSDISTENFACKPRILHPRTHALMVEATGDNATLVCRISGNPRPEIEWIFNGRPINFNDQRILIRNSQEANRRDAIDVYTSELTILGVRHNDRGDYFCAATNQGGHAEMAFHVTTPMHSIERIGAGAIQSSSKNLWLVVGQVLIVLLVILIVVGMVHGCYRRRIIKYSNNSISESGLELEVLDNSKRGKNVSVAESSMIGGMSEVNPVEKPPRRARMDGSGDITEEAHDQPKMPLDETRFGKADDDIQSVSLSDTTTRSRTTFIDDGYGTDLPPDLLAFPTRLSQSPLIPRTVSNMQDPYDTKTPAVTCYQNHPSRCEATNSGYRTLQLHKPRNFALHQSCSQSPFTPIPYPVIVKKQCYDTTPRTPRAPSWTPPLEASAMTADYQLDSPAITTAVDPVDSVYDNLGRRTTSSGNPALNLKKLIQMP